VIKGMILYRLFVYLPGVIPNVPFNVSNDSHILLVMFFFKIKLQVK